MPSRTYRDLGYVTVRLRHVWSTDLDMRLNALAEEKHVGLAALVDILLWMHFDEEQRKAASQAEAAPYVERAKRAIAQAQS